MEAIRVRFLLAFVVLAVAIPSAFTLAAAADDQPAHVEIGTAAFFVRPPVPGQSYHAVTQATLNQTVCVKGWTSTVRPPFSYTSALKRWLLKDRQLPGTVSQYQLDHMESLELGGAPYSTQNLFMQPIAQAHVDDAKENAWHADLCAGRLTLKQARQAELSWKRTNG
jgi:hypothetical protein